MLETPTRVLGTPANIGYISGALKRFFDQICYPVPYDTSGLRYGCYVHGNLGIDAAVNAIGQIAEGLEAGGRAGRGHRRSGRDRASALLGAGCHGGRHPDGPPGPRRALCAMALAYRASALHEPHFYRVMFSPSDIGTTTDAESLRRAEATYQPLRDVTRRAVDAGLFRAESLDVLATSIWGTVHGLVSLELDALLPAGAGESVEVYRGAVLALCTGWRADPHPSS